MPYTFKSVERIKSRKAIEELILRGVGYYTYPLRVVFLFRAKSRNEPLRVAMSVSRRKFKHAVDRNKIKRRLKEAWRLNKELLRESLNKLNLEADVLLIYTSNTEESFELVNEKIMLVLNRLITEAEQFVTTNKSL